LCADAGFIGAVAKQDMLDRAYTLMSAPRRTHPTHELTAAKRGRRRVEEREK
jgi:hypothetical protein